MLVRPGTFRNHTSPALKAWVDTLRTFHANGYDGFILDASDISTLNQVSTGTTPVTAVTQPIGWFGDKHLGMQLGPEIYAGGEITVQPAAEASVGATTSGKLYLLQVPVGLQGNFGPGWNTTASATGLHYRVADGASFRVRNFGATPVTFTPTLRLLDGNHPLQATGPARPTWQVDANGYHYAQFLGTDDSVSCATVGGGSTGFLLCAAITHAAGGVINTLFSDVGTNTGYEIEISALDKLTFTAGNGTLITTLTSTASITVGTTTYITVWDDGVNLNLQIDGGAVESVARPVVVAGTAGYTIGKDNGFDLHHFVGSFYRGTYIKNWAGTAAQLASIQSWVKAGAGL